MIRFLLYLALAAGLTYCGATVKLGKRTLFGHIRAIWATEEVQDLAHGVEEQAGPAVDRVKRGFKAGIKAAKDDDAEGSASGSGSGSGSGSATAPAQP
jgi:hypothetical protein